MRQGQPKLKERIIAGQKGNKPSVPSCYASKIILKGRCRCLHATDCFRVAMAKSRGVNIILDEGSEGNE